MDNNHFQAPFYPGFDGSDGQSGATTVPQIEHVFAQVQYVNNPPDPMMAGIHPLGGTVDPRDLSLSPSTPTTHTIGPSLSPSSPLVPTGASVASSIAHKRRTHARRNPHHRDAPSYRRSACKRDVYIPYFEIEEHVKRLRETLDLDRVTGHVRTRPLKEQTELFKPFVRLEGPSPRERIRKCLICGYTIINGTQIIQHVMDHFRHYPFQCNEPDCTFSSTRPADLKKHSKEQHDERHAGFTCSKCLRTIRHERNFRRHARIHCSANLTR